MKKVHPEVNLSLKSVVSVRSVMEGIRSRMLGPTVCGSAGCFVWLCGVGFFFEVRGFRLKFLFLAFSWYFRSFPDPSFPVAYALLFSSPFLSRPRLSSSSLVLVSRLLLSSPSLSSSPFHSRLVSRPSLSPSLPPPGYLRPSLASMHSVACGTFMSLSLGINLPVVLQIP